LYLPFPISSPFATILFLESLMHSVLWTSEPHNALNESHGVTICFLMSQVLDLAGTYIGLRANTR